MSDYCGRCRFDPKVRVGPSACPFNALYWDFLARHEAKLRGNMRLRQMYSTWDRMSEIARAETRGQAAVTLDGLEPAARGWAR